MSIKNLIIIYTMALTNENYKELADFIKNNRILAIAMAGMLSRYISEIIDSFADNIVVPVLFDDSDSDEDEEPTKTKTKMTKEAVKKNFVKVGKVKFKVGMFFVEFIKFTVMLIITIIILVMVSRHDLV